MIPTINKQLKQYYRQIKLFLPINTAGERFFLRHLKCSISDYIEENPNCTMNDITDIFGIPKDVVHDYISNLDQFQLCRKMAIKKHIRLFLVFALLLSVIAFAFRVGVIYNIHQHEQTQVVTQESSTIN